jgi:uncharacterized protein
VDITPLISADRQVIQSYSSAGFKVSGIAYQGAVIVFPDRTLRWNMESVRGLSVSDLAVFDKNDVDILIIGCGEKAVRMEPPVVHALKAKGVLLETMATGAACRTYNVLMAEGRRIAAALIPAEKLL